MVQPINYEKHGGMWYDTNQAKAGKTKDGKYTLTYKSGVITYPEQTHSQTGDKKQQPIIIKTVDEGWFVDDDAYEISNVMGATFNATKDANVKVKLTKGSNNNVIDVSANSKNYFGDTLTFDASTHGNKAILDDDDVLKLKGDVTVEGAGTANQDDHVPQSKPGMKILTISIK